MKKLILIRHAKSSWKDSELDDHERPLNKRGDRDRLTLARYLADTDLSVEVIYSSTAVRALELAQTISEFTQISLVPDLSFYTFDPDQLLQIIQSLPEEASSVCVVGHNPAITQLSNSLCNTELLNVPTSGVVTMTFELDDWHDIERGLAEFEGLVSPKIIAKMEG